MSANFLHGVETIELNIGPRPIRGVKTAVIGLVGTAPLFDVDAAYHSPNQSTLVRNDVQARKFFGSNRSGYSIPAALEAGFDQGNGPIYVVVNVLDPAVHVTAVTNESVTLDAKGVAALAHEQVTSVVVKNSGGTTTYVAGTDYTVAQGDGKVTRKEGGAIAAGASLKVTYEYLDPSKVTTSELIGEVNDAGERTGMQLFLESYQRYGFYPKILITPGYSSTTAIAAEMGSIAGRVRAIAVFDAPAGTTPEQAITGRGPEGTINFNTSSERAVLAYPHVKKWDSASNSEVLYPLSPYYAGVLARSDIENGYWFSPSNQEIKGITGLERHITAMINDPTSEANMLNEVGITTVFNSFGSGFRVLGF